MSDKFNHIFIAPSDWEKSYRFYKDTLGWELISSWGENSESRGAILESSSKMRVVIAEEHESDDHSWSHGFNGTRATIHLETDKLKERFELINDDQCVVVPPEITHWGNKWFVLKDPDNNLIAFNEKSK